MDDAYQVRNNVFVKEQQVPVEVEIDQYEDNAIHFIAYEDNFPIGAGRLREVDQGGKVERVCVKKEYRSKGIGYMLMEYIEQTAQNHGIQALLLNSQTHAQSFYENCGYKVISTQFFEAGMPHVAMKKSLAVTD